MTRKGIRIEGLRKRYGSGDTAVDALKGVSMEVAPGEVVGLIGPSGSGKSTLLKSLGAVIDPTGGRMTLGDEVIYDEGWRVDDLRALRRDRIGFVFQAPYLIPFLDVTDNVALLPMLAGQDNASARKRALDQANREGTDEQDVHVPDEIEYRYPGPRPQTREAAILMICDAVESAARALSDPTPARLEALVNTIVNKRLLDGQFDCCGLTLSELATIEDSLVKSLTAVYHGRIKYPEARPAQAG